MAEIHHDFIEETGNKTTTYTGASVFAFHLLAHSGTDVPLYHFMLLHHATFQNENNQQPRK